MEGPSNLHYYSLIKSRYHLFFFGGQGHPGRARGTQGKARGPPGSPGYPFPSFPLGPSGPPWLPLASKKLENGSTFKETKVFSRPPQKKLSLP